MYLSIDIGGTTTRVAYSTNCKDISKVDVFDTAPDLDTFQATLSARLVESASAGSIQKIAVGVAGIIESPTGTVVYSPNINYLTGFSFVRFFESQQVKAQVFVGNDAYLAALGEACFGAGKEYTRVGYVGIGTGIGGALIFDKKFDTTIKYFEPGHQIINFDENDRQTFGINGTYESYASGRSFESVYGMKPEKCRDTSIWKEYGAKVAIGLINLNFLWAPDVLIIGGGMSERFELFDAGIRGKISEIQHLTFPKVLKSEYGQGSGVIGGFAWLDQL